jgi:molybdopterin biosynthesis enzyme MoaB
LNCASSFLSTTMSRSMSRTQRSMLAGEVLGVEGVLAHGGTGPTGVTIGFLDDVLMFGLDGWSEVLHVMGPHGHIRFRKLLCFGVWFAEDSRHG